MLSMDFLRSRTKSGIQRESKVNVIAKLRKFYRYEFTAYLWDLLNRECNAAIKITREELYIVLTIKAGSTAN